MSDNKLILIPRDMEFSSSGPDKIVTCLRKVSFIADSIDSAEAEALFHAGDRFLDLITFVGCSPVTDHREPHLCSR